MKHAVIFAALWGLLLATTACQQGSFSASPGSIASKGIDQPGGSGGDILPDTESKEAIREAEKAASEVEEALDAAQSTLGELLDDKGRVREDLFTQSSSSQSVETQSIFAIFSFISGPLTKVFDRVLEQIKRSTAVFDQTRAKIADQLSKLDPSNPAHASAIASLMAAMERVDLLEGQYKSVVHNLASKIDMIVNQIDNITSRLGFFGFILQLITDQVKLPLLDLKSKLMSL